MSAIASVRFVDPSPHESIFRNVDVQPADDAPLSRYGDVRWDLYPLAQKVSSGALYINFALVPLAFVDGTKRLVWAWINQPTPLDLIDRTTAMRQRISASTIVSLFREDLLPFLRWLDGRGHSSLGAVETDDLETYASEVMATGVSRERKARVLFTVSRVWLHSPYMPPEDRLCIPPWEEKGIADLLGPSTWTAENKTPPVHPQTMSPLLLWALRFVDIFAADILRAVAERDRLQANIPTSKAATDNARVLDYIRERSAAGRLLPGWSGKGRENCLAQDYIAGTLGVGLNAVLVRHLGIYGVEGGAPLAVGIQGRWEDGEVWTETIDYYDVPKLKTLLATACLVVVAYLSGIRSDEVRELRRGCCRQRPRGGDGPPQFEITGLEFKSALDEDGNTIPGGRIRERPWFVIAPVARAVAVAEALSEGELLFDAALFARIGAMKQTGRAVTAKTTRDRLGEFVAWVNQFASHSRHANEQIPDDPEGEVRLVRFRRTLAWFIYRRPQGRVALGVQYGHLRGYTSEGYGSRTSSGLRDVFPMEEVRAIADSLTTAVERLDAGEGVSGPAARRYIEGVTEFATAYAGRWFTPRQATALRKNPKLRIHDNGFQPLACCYDATKALCHPDRERHVDASRTPDITRCVSGCGNVARTDAHIASISGEIEWRETEAASPFMPEPLRERHLQRVATLKAIVEKHGRTKIVRPAAEEVAR